MNIIEKLSEEFKILRRKQKVEKHIAVKNEDFLHSGELSVIDFIDSYNHKNMENPKLVEISRALELSQATVTVLVNRLIEKGLVEKNCSPENKSKKIVTLTEKGQHLLEKRRNRDVEKLMELVEYLGKEDSENLLKITKKINQFYDRFYDGR